MTRSCTICVNDDRNPWTPIGVDGLCPVCRNHWPDAEQPKKSVLDSLAGQTAMIGLSGGKDSTAAAVDAKKLGMNLVGFTFDIGYYPAHLVPAAKKCASMLGIEHEVIYIWSYIHRNLRTSYRLTATLYDDLPNRDACRDLYSLNRKHYSVKKECPMPFLRSCQLCRKAVIPAYYGEALSRGIKYVILGINEWTHLSATTVSSGVRRLQPFADKPPVDIVHLPYLLGRTLDDTAETAKAAGWQPPRNEEFVETNGNSCCLARAMQAPFQQILGFHPDTTRLARGDERILATTHRRKEA